MAKRDWNKLYANYTKRYDELKKKKLILSDKLSIQKFKATIKVKESSLSGDDLTKFKKNPIRDILKHQRNLTESQIEAIKKKIESSVSGFQMSELKPSDHNAFNTLKALYGYSDRKFKKFLTHIQTIGTVDISGFDYVKGLVESLFEETFSDFMDSP